MADPAPLPPLPEKGFFRWLPGLWVLKHYHRSWLAPDLTAGLVLTALLVPAGMGYAVAAGLPAITGLYATIFPLIAYALAGPSRILVLGPDSALSAIIAATVLPLAQGDSDKAVVLAAALAILTGLMCAAGGVARLGFLTDLLSKPVRVGYINGIALTVIVTQLPKLCGFSSKGDGVPQAAAAFVQGALEGKVKWVALAIGGVSIIVIFALKALAPKVPGVLVAVVVGTVVTWKMNLPISVVGAVPGGVPRPGVPIPSWGDLTALVSGAAGIALVSFADTSVLSRTFAARSGQRVDPNHELIGLGIANIAGGFFQGFPISSSASRTPVAEAAGSKTQLTGVVGAIAIVALIIVAPGLVKHLPTTALAAVVIAAAVGLIDIKEMRVFARVRRSDFFVAVFCFAAVAAFGPITGIAMSVGVSLLDFFRRAWRPYEAILGRAQGVKGYHDITRYPSARQVPGLLLYRWDAPLFFANADTFRARILEMVEDSKAPIKWVIVAAEPITDVDTTAAEMIEELDLELAKRGTELAFAEMKDPVKDRLAKYGLQAKIGRDYFYPTIGVGVKAFLDQTGAEWVDWEDTKEEAEDEPPPSRQL